MADWIKIFEDSVLLQSMEVFKESLGDDERQYIDYTWGHVRHRSFDTNDLIFQVIEVHNEALVIWCKDGKEWIEPVDDFKRKLHKEASGLPTKDAAIDWLIAQMFRYMR